MEQLTLNFPNWTEKHRADALGAQREQFLEDFEIFQTVMNNFARDRFGANSCNRYEQAVLCAVHAIGVLLDLGAKDTDIKGFFELMISDSSSVLVPANYREMVPANEPCPDTQRASGASFVDLDVVTSARSV